jgi:hypothetical protein
MYQLFEGGGGDLRFSHFVAFDIVGNDMIYLLTAIG